METEAELRGVQVETVEKGKVPRRNGTGSTQKAHQTAGVLHCTRIASQPHSSCLMGCCTSSEGDGATFVGAETADDSER